MPAVITLPRDTRWGELGEGLSNVLGAAVSSIEDMRVAHGVADVDQDVSIPDDQKYDTILRRFGSRGAALFNDRTRAKIIQQQLQDSVNEKQATGMAWSGVLGAGEQPGVAGAALGVKPPETGAVRGSWYGNYGQWRDPSDTGLQASGAPVSSGPGIALPSRATLGQEFDVTAPSGKTYRLKQTDVGPAARTGRGVDINAAAAEQMGYTPATFPTDAPFQVKPTGKMGVRANDIAGEALQGIPALQYGSVQRHQLAKAIEEANPRASPAVKMMAFEQASKVLAPEEKMAWELAKTQMQADLRVGLAEFGAKMAEQRLQERFAQQSAMQSTRQEAKDKGVFTDAEASFWANYLKTVGSLPAGISRSSAAVRQIMGKAADVGGDPGKMAENLSTFKADQHSLASATKLADAATSFEATALKNLDVASKELGKASPTGLGPWLNKWIETGETQIGNKEVPASITAVLTFANEYAKVMSGSTGVQGATVDARREAAELFSPYFNAGQWDEVARIARQDMANRKASLYEQVDAIRERIKNVGSGTPAKDVMERAQPIPPPVSAREEQSGAKGGTDWSKKTDEEILRELGIRQ